MPLEQLSAAKLARLEAKEAQLNKHAITDKNEQREHDIQQRLFANQQAQTEAMKHIAIPNVGKGTTNRFRRPSCTHTNKFQQPVVVRRVEIPRLFLPVVSNRIS